MNSKSIVAIGVIGLLGLIAFIFMAKVGVQALSEQPLIQVSVMTAEKFKVREVTLAFDPSQPTPRILRLGYETSVLHGSLDARTLEMEEIARFALESVRTQEFSADIKQRNQGKGMPPPRTPIGVVKIHRTWRRDSGCFKSTDETNHEWTPPPAPRGR